MSKKTYTIRRVSSLNELHEAFAIIGAQITPPVPANDRRIDALVKNFPKDRSLMLVVERYNHIIGGALGFGSTLRIIGLEPSARGIGLGRRLLQTFEVAAIAAGLMTISLAADEAKDFYLKMGYQGKNSLHKELPLPGIARDRMLKKIETMIGDLETGQTLQEDSSGNIPPLF